ncbi:MAG: hypothetical protein U0441_18575 [Polyangiaceae bacterium]
MVDPFGPPENPFYLVCAPQDGGTGEMDPVPVQITDEKGNEVALADVGRPKSLVVTFLLRLKNIGAGFTAPARIKAMMPNVAVRPSGSSRVVLPSNFRTWDAPGITKKRKRLLAAIGNTFPQAYVPVGGHLGGGDPYCGIPYQLLTCWDPIKKGTSCTGINGMIEAILTGSKGRWSFSAPMFEEEQARRAS